LLRSGLLLALGGASQALAGCTSSGSPPPAGTTTPPRTASDSTPIGGDTPTTGRILLAYFSRPGENYYYGGRRDLEVGNTQVLAEIISELIDCDVFRIEAADPYPDDYDATVARNVTEQNAGARPAIADPLDSIDGYQHVLLGSPIWNVRPPMIMNTFADSYDFAGRTVHPFVTYAVSSLGGTERVYTDACAGAQIRPGLAVQGEEVSQHRDDVETWLRQSRLLS
jgi:flavodoxin